MKKSVLFVTAFLAISLCSCSISSDTNIKTLEVDDYLCALTEDGVKTEQQITYRVVEGEELLPYFTLYDYFELLNGYKKENWEYICGTSFGNQYVTVLSPSGEAYYSMLIDNSSKYFSYTGDMSYAFTVEKDLDKSSLYIQYSGGGALLNDAKNIKKFYYSDLDFTTFIKGGKRYYPLSLLDINFSTMTGIHHLFNYKRLVQYTDVKQLEKDKYLVEGKSISAYEEMNTYIKDVMNDVMPMYLRKDRQASFLYIMENLYGLKSTRNIESMKEYLEKQSFFADFLSENSVKRREAFCKVFELLDDGHTVSRDSNNYPWYEGTINQYGSKIQSMIALNKILTPARAEAGLTPGQVYYSTDGKVAYFTFDSFTFVYDAFEEDGETLKGGLSDYNSEDYDSYFYISRLLKEIKAKGGVEDVVIDISTNGGGTIGVLTKILALMSKNNRGTVYAYSEIYNAPQSIYAKVDSNGDGVFDNADCFGNDFKFHLLTSPYSFSCGNLYPLAVKKGGLGTVIGVQSGGGECSVEEAYLPSGEHFYHSSNMHIGWVTAGEFKGGEDGVPVDKALEYDDFYNIDKIQSVLNA